MLQPTAPLATPRQLTLEHMEVFISQEAQHHVAQCNDLILHSHFQPVYSLAHQRTVGYEALVRPFHADGKPVAPLALFPRSEPLEKTVFIDRLCRTLHVRNFSALADDKSWLFLNLNPQVTIHGKQFGSFFHQLLQQHDISPSRVVIEILEEQINDEKLLAESISYYRDMGCLIAIDDFGVGHSNFDRIWRIAPHIVKLDRSMILQAASNRSVQRVLPNLVNLIHQSGSLVLLEGIETEQQAMIALQSDIDFVQGFYFARPDSRLPTEAFHPTISNLFNILRQQDQINSEVRQFQLARHTNRFYDASIRIRSGDAPESALQSLLALPDVFRCYLLDGQGRQVGQNVTADTMIATEDPRFAPLQDARNAIWARRHYYQEALAEPGRTRISKPYLSITGGNLCVTLSIAISTPEGLRVLCSDILWREDER